MKAPRWLNGFIGIAGVLVIWQILGATGAFHNSIASPTAILRSMREDGWGFFAPNISMTMREAAYGWLWGNTVAIALGLIIILLPRTERPIMRISIAAYCVPLLAIGPILQIIFGVDSPTTPKIILAALTCFFTTLVGMVVGLKSADKSSLELIRAYGGGSLSQLRKVRLKACLPSLFAGLRIAAPTAILGAIIGEYLGGDQGLGIALINSQQGLHIARTWSLAVVATALAGLAYALTAFLGRLSTPWIPKAAAR